MHANVPKKGGLASKARRAGNIPAVCAMRV